MRLRIDFLLVNKKFKRVNISEKDRKTNRGGYYLIKELTWYQHDDRHLPHPGYLPTSKGFMSKFISSWRRKTEVYSSVVVVGKGVGVKAE